MSTVLFKRGDTATLDELPMTDGMLFFNEENHKIYMDNGTERFQYGGDTELITDAKRARLDNALSARTSIDIFLQKTTVVDDKSAALAVNTQYIPLGCLAFKETVGNNNISDIGDGTLSGSIKALGGVIINGQLAKGDTTLIVEAPTATASSYIDVYTDNWKVSPKNVVVDEKNHNITLTFSAQTQTVNVRVIVRNR